METVTLTPIGSVHCTRTRKEDDHWDAEQAWIELDPSQFAAEALAGLADFSHVAVVFHLNQVDPAGVEMGARHPRGNPNWPKVGIFAQRGKDRPNRIGITVCRVRKIDGLALHVEGLDAIDGTPVLDIKPWVAELGPRGPVYQPLWMTELMHGYWR